MPDKVILKWDRTQGLIERTMDWGEIWGHIAVIFLFGFMLGFFFLLIILSWKDRPTKIIPSKRVFIDPTDEEMRMIFMPIYLNLLSKWNTENDWSIKEAEKMQEMAERLAEPLIRERRNGEENRDSEVAIRRR